MVESARYRALGRSLSWLKRHHLSFAPRLAGDYTDRQLSQAAAYTVFAHGEFENFLEDWATLILDTIANKGFSNGFSPMLGHLIAYAKDPISVPPQIPPNNNRPWQTKAGSVVNAHRGLIKNNHGIRERHLCALLIPLGVDVVSIDQVLVSDLDAFARIRGDHAHQSRQRHLSQQFDPFDRLQKVTNIYQLLLPLDELLQRHLTLC